MDILFTIELLGWLHQLPASHTHHPWSKRDALPIKIQGELDKYFQGLTTMDYGQVLQVKLGFQSKMTLGTLIQKFNNMTRRWNKLYPHQLAKPRISSFDVIPVAWLYRSSYWTNRDTLQAAIDLALELANQEYQWAYMKIKVSSQEPADRANFTRTAPLGINKAVCILGDRRMVKSLLATFRTIYGEDKKTGFPLHRCYYISPTLDTIGVRATGKRKGLEQLRETHNAVVASYLAISTDNIVVLDSSPSDAPEASKITPRDIVMGICDPHDNTINLFQGVWMGASDHKIHFVTLGAQEAAATECVDVLGQVVTTWYDCQDSAGNNRYWQWFSDFHHQEMEQLTYDTINNRWTSSYDDPLTEVIKATTDPNLAEIALGEDDEMVCMISGIQIVDAHWTTTRMGGVSGDQELSSVMSRASTNTLTVLDEDPTVESGRMNAGHTTLHTHQSLGGQYNRLRFTYVLNILLRHHQKSHSGYFNERENYSPFPRPTWQTLPQD